MNFSTLYVIEQLQVTDAMVIYEFISQSTITHIILTFTNKSTYWAQDRNNVYTVMNLFYNFDRCLLFAF